MLTNPSATIWFLTGSQHLYGSDVLETVASHAQTIVRDFQSDPLLPVPFRYHPVVTSPESIRQACQAADQDPHCIGVVAWMHTFSPAKMWVNGWRSLRKPLCQLHTQFNDEIPWEHIDMDFMNLNQSAHGDREAGFLLSRMRRNRKVVTGHWKSPSLRTRLGQWCRVALAWQSWQSLKVARIGDNMREVAVTEGDKVEAALQFGFSVNGYDSSEVLRHLPAASDPAVRTRLEEYGDLYDLSPPLRPGGAGRDSLVAAARIEQALRSFLASGGFDAFTDTFENLGAFEQLPGIAVQRLMQDGYGFGAEGDWKTAALLRALKVMSAGSDKGTSFMEDYTYHFRPDASLVLGAHMLEICPSIAAGRPSCEVHPLSIGGKADPVRLVFDGAEGPALNVCLLDMGGRFRLVVNEVESVSPPNPLPRLPVARVLWKPAPDLETAATAWLLAGGAHHTVYSQALTTELVEDFADIAGIEMLVIDHDTRLRAFKELIRSNEVYYHLFRFRT
ncbi:MAG: hypothetical protein RLY31_1186 [Bacteroidota bacterium]|jgi:L-arabinose isomerase